MSAEGLWKLKEQALRAKTYEELALLTEEMKSQFWETGLKIYSDDTIKNLEKWLAIIKSWDPKLNPLGKQDVYDKLLARYKTITLQILEETNINTKFSKAQLLNLRAEIWIKELEYVSRVNNSFDFSFNYLRWWKGDIKVIEDKIKELTESWFKVIKWYSNLEWVTIVKVEDFEKTLREEPNLNKINSQALASYIEYVYKAYPKDKEFVGYLTQALGVEKFKALVARWDNPKEKSIAKDTLIKIGLWSLVEKIAKVNLDNLVAQLETYSSKAKVTPKIKEWVLQKPIERIQTIDNKVDIIAILNGLPKDAVFPFNKIPHEFRSDGWVIQAYKWKLESEDIAEMGYDAFFDEDDSRVSVDLKTLEVLFSKCAWDNNWKRTIIEKIYIFAKERSSGNRERDGVMVWLARLKFILEKFWDRFDLLSNIPDYIINEDIKINWDKHILPKKWLEWVIRDDVSIQSLRDSIRVLFHPTEKDTLTLYQPKASLEPQSWEYSSKGIGNKQDYFRNREWYILAINDYIDQNGIDKPESKELIERIIAEGHTSNFTALLSYAWRSVEFCEKMVKWNILDLKYVPQNLRKDSRIIDAFLEKSEKSSLADVAIYIEYLEFSNLTDVIKVYKSLTKKIPEILVAEGLLLKIRKILIEYNRTKIQNGDTRGQPQLSYEDSEILKRITDKISEDFSNLENIDPFLAKIFENLKVSEEQNEVQYTDNVRGAIWASLKAINTNVSTKWDETSKAIETVLTFLSETPNWHSNEKASWHILKVIFKWDREAFASLLKNIDALTLVKIGKSNFKKSEVLGLSGKHLGKINSQWIIIDKELASIAIAIPIIEEWKKTDTEQNFRLVPKYDIIKSNFFLFTSSIPKKSEENDIQYITRCRQLYIKSLDWKSLEYIEIVKQGIDIEEEVIKARQKVGYPKVLDATLEGRGNEILTTQLATQFWIPENILKWIPSQPGISELKTILPASEHFVITSWNEIYLVSPKDGQKIPITPDELSEIYNHPERQENLIDAYNLICNTFKLEQIWKYRKFITQAIRNSGSSNITFNVWNNLWTKDSIKTFIIGIGLSVWKIKWDFKSLEAQDLSVIEWKLIAVNQWDWLVKRSEDSNGRWVIEQAFINKFDPGGMMNNTSQIQFDLEKTMRDNLHY